MRELIENRTKLLAIRILELGTVLTVSEVARQPCVRLFDVIGV